MHDLYVWPTPNGYKVLIFAEEAGLDCTLKPVNLAEREQFEPEYLRISPNHRMPALVDHAPASGKGPISVFESGAILLYLADKLAKFIPPDPTDRAEVLPWLFFEASNLCPTAVQIRHFRLAAEQIPYAIDRFLSEMGSLYGVLNHRLAGRRFIAGGDFTIADMVSYPWILPDANRLSLDDFPHVRRWRDEIAARPAVVRAYETGRSIAAAAGARA